MPFDEEDLDPHGECAAEIAKLRSALASCASWIDRWTAHVGRCEGGNKCTCGRTAVLAEAAFATPDTDT